MKLLPLWTKSAAFEFKILQCSLALMRLIFRGRGLAVALKTLALSPEVFTQTHTQTHTHLRYSLPLLPLRGVISLR